MDQDTFNATIGKNLRRFRMAARLTQDEVASNIGVSRATIANMETGRQAMSAYQLVRIARALNLPSLDDLFDSRLGANPIMVTPYSSDLLRLGRVPGGRSPISSRGIACRRLSNGETGQARSTHM